MKAIIYTKDFCPYCVKAKRTLEKYNIEIEEIDITNDEQKQEEVVRLSGRMTMPQVFFHVGGSDDLDTLESLGGLDFLAKK